MQDKQDKQGVWIHGSSGRMGREIQRTIVDTSSNFRLIGGSAARFEGEHFQQGKAVTPHLLAQALANPEVKLILDFSSPEGNSLLLEAAKEGSSKSQAFVIGTTGLSADSLDAWRQTTKERGLTTLFAPNTSIGILLLAKTALIASSVCAPLGFDIEIVEAHHRMKKDAPSGTAKFLAETIMEGVAGHQTVYQRSGARQPGEIGMHAIRGGAVFGEHEIRIIGDGEELTLSHRAFSRTLFASGALVLSRWLLTQKPACYGLLDIPVEDLARLGTSRV